MDGMTWDAKVDTNNGHIEILGHMLIDESGDKPRGSYKDIANKFFELESQVPG
jgi:hypothetical protein